MNFSYDKHEVEFPNGWVEVADFTINVTKFWVEQPSFDSQGDCCCEYEIENLEIADADEVAISDMVEEFPDFIRPTKEQVNDRILDTIEDNVFEKCQAFDDRDC